MAALTRSGARKASEIVMFTLRTLHPSRLCDAVRTVVVASAIQFIEPTAPAGDRWRPRSRGVSERIGRAW